MSRSVPNAFESRSSHSSGERKRVGGGGHFNQTIFGGPPESVNHSYAVAMHLLNTANRLLMVFRDNPCLMLFALNCSTCIALISSIRIFPKYGMSAQFSVLRFVFCSEYLLLGTEYTSNHFQANSSNVGDFVFVLEVLFIGSPRASFPRNTAS
jgi:hypothetical protein